MTKPFKQRMTYPLIGFLLLITTIIGTLFYFDRFVSQPVQVEELKIDTEAALKLNILKQISKKNGITEWELEAASATLFKNENRAVLINVSVTFFTKESKKVFLKAKKGDLNTRTHDMTLSDSVVINYENSTLSTDKLHYNKKKHMIYSNAHVKLTREGSVIEADSMTIKLDDNYTVLKGHVKGKFHENFNVL